MALKENRADAFDDRGVAPDPAPREAAARNQGESTIDRLIRRRRLLGERLHAGDGPDQAKPGPANPDPGNTAGPASPTPDRGPSHGPASRSPAAMLVQANLPVAPSQPNVAPPSGAEMARVAAAVSARPKRRHGLLALAFLFIVLAPVGLAGWYLYARAADQYASHAAFSVRSEEVSSSLDILSGFSAFGAVSSKDVDILFEYIGSQGLVAEIDREIDLRAVYARYVEQDPVFSFHPAGTIEDLHQYWSRMVKVYYDRGTGLIELRVNAFSPQEAQNIAASILNHGADLINQLSAVARDDATGYARDELERSVARLREARRAITEYRSQNQMVDPAVEIGIQTGLISALQTQLSEAMVDYNLLKGSVSADSRQLQHLERRVAVLRQSIDDERLKFGASPIGEAGYSSLVGEYESLVVDLEFAEQAYVAALAAFDAAQVAAQRKSRYLAAHIEPTLAERATYPERLVLVGVLSMFAFFAWAILALVYYAIRDRR